MERNRYTLSRGAVLLTGLLALAVSDLAAQARQRVDTLMQRLLNDHDYVMVAAHRGSHLEAPENSLACIEESIAEGVDIIELDVRQTKDGELVIVHDPTVDRTTTGKGPVDSLTLAELKSLRLLHNGEPTSQQVPTLREALKAVKGHMIVDIDFKADDAQAVRECYRIIAELGMERQVIFFAYDHAQVPELRSLNPEVLVMPRANSVGEIREIMNDAAVRIIHIDESCYDDKLARAMRKKGIRIWANALGKPDQKAASLDGDYSDFFRSMPLVNIVQTDRPEMLLEYLGRELATQPGPRR